MSPDLEKLLDPAVQKFLRENEHADDTAIALRGKLIGGVAAGLIAQQLSGRRKAKDKLPLFYNSKNIVYPPAINLEQCSSETTALLKVSILQDEIKSSSSVSGADLTGGFGVDSFFLSRLCLKFDYADTDTSILEIAKHNHRAMGAENIFYHNQKAEEFIATSTDKYTFIYFDPSRRKQDKKVFRLADCEPNAAALLPDLFLRTDLVLIKASPLLDLQQGLRELIGVRQITIAAVKNECRELLFLCQKDFVGEPVVSCVNLASNQRDKSHYSFSFSAEKNAFSAFSDPRNYLYEPNAAILKGGAFKLIGQELGLCKLQQHTHIYTSDDLVNDFPGRVFHVEAVRPDLHKLKNYFPDSKANVITRNYPVSPDALKKKLKLKDGGDKFLICFSGSKEKFTVVASRV